MKKQQSGFTLIELIIVIVILGALAAVALPRFIDLQTQAEEAGLQGVAGGMASAAAVNYAGFLAGGDSVDITDCDGVGGAMQGGIPDGYSVEEANGAGSATGDEFDCEVTRDGSSVDAVTFTAIRVES